MLIYTSKEYWNIKHIAILILLVLICYWPLSFGIFSVKNDNITQFLPVRFHVSEALRNGHLPLWSPYMYLGYPIHGDMQGGAWNPIVWFISIFSRYNIISLHWEILIYIILAGLGMYRLLGALKINEQIKLIGAASYLMCGYVTDVAGSNAPFLAAAAYIPFVLAYSYHFLGKAALYNSIKFAISIWLLFTSSYPSFFIITVYILAFAIIIVFIRKLLQRDYVWARHCTIYLLFTAILSAMLSAPAILSYIQILPDYARYNGVSLEQAFENYFHPTCSLSLLFPSTVSKYAPSFSTDLISRNIYFNVFILGGVLCGLLIKTRKTALYYFTLIGTIFFFFFSIGPFSPIRTFCYHFIPLMDTFRHPSNARLFVIIGGIIIAALYFNTNGFTQKSQRITVSLLGLISIVSLFFSCFHLTIFFLEIPPFGSFRDHLKWILETLSFYDLLFINSIIQLVFVITYIILARTHFRKYFPFLFITNSFLFAQLLVPYTLVSKTSPAAGNNILNSVPRSYPLPNKLRTIEENSVDSVSIELDGNKSFYNKSIATNSNIFTPTYMSLYDQSVKDNVIKKIIFSNPYAYLAKKAILNKDFPIETYNGIVLLTSPISKKMSLEHEGTFRLNHMSNNVFNFEIYSYGQSILCLQQLFLKGWYCTIDQKITPIYKANIGYMAVSIPAGIHEVVFTYKPKGIYESFWVHITALGFTFLLLLRLFWCKMSYKKSIKVEGK